MTTIKHLKVQHGLYKNLPSGTVYNSQAAAVIFALGMAFKVSAFPSIIAEYYGSSTLFVYLLFSIVELFICVVVFAMVRMRADSFLRVTNSSLYKLVCLLTAIWLMFKGVFYFCYSASYLTHELFGGTAPSLVYFLLLAPIAYLGIKGARSISRTSEIFVPFFFVIIVLNLVFLKTDLDIGRNLPIFSVEPADFFKNIFKYGLWIGDIIPFMFLRIKNKRLPYISSSIGVSVVLVLIAIFLGVSIYGDSLKTVTDLLIRLAGFNQISLEIGRMEWTNLFAIVTLSIISESFLFFGCTSAFERAAGFAIPIQIVYPIILLSVALFSKSTQVVTQFSHETIGYLLFGAAVAVPLIMLFAFLMNKRKFKGLYRVLDAEYIPKPIEPPVVPDSLADDVLVGMKEEAKVTQTVLPNGSLQPAENGSGSAGDSE